MRSPLNAIAGWAQVLRAASSTSTTGALTEALEAIERNVGHLTRIADTLVDAADGDAAAPAPHAAAPPLAAPSIAAAPKHEPLRVLVVDDDREARETTARLLRGRGYDVALADSALAAIHLYFDTGFDVLVTDIGMAGVDGYELLRLLRSERRQSPIPAIAVTGFTGRRARKRAFDAGFQAHLAKPVQGRQLVDAVARVAGLAQS